MKTRQVLVPGAAGMAAMLVALAGAPTARAQQMGRIVVSNDEWPMAAPGFSQPCDGLMFATNIASWFTGGEPGSFLVWNHYAFTDPELASAMTGAGHSWTVTSNANLTLAMLQPYDGVFLSGATFPSQVLIDYVEDGGNVYVAGGTGAWLTPGWEANAWNPFLEHFGLRFHDLWNTTNAPIEVNETHAIFVGVDHLLNGLGQGVFDLQPENPANRILLPVPGAPEQGHYAVFDASGCVADCNADGVLTVADFGCFQTRFVAGDPYADCNGTGGLTVADFGCFQTTFVAGCP